MWILLRYAKAALMLKYSHIRTFSASKYFAWKNRVESGFHQTKKENDGYKKSLSSCEDAIGADNKNIAKYSMKGFRLNAPSRENNISF
ncbi:hypothetical protein NPIL_657191 [Nephila pilipes]|uniref:Uncharacterized protein n=1 Tax=Nephila pilipes TaxID=299642 RepID=A0A8X6R9F6_NEPPI|nr:hypothetical protein NPIL_657191 [Nephila pilipes]